MASARIDRAVMKRVAANARLVLTEAEEKKYSKDLNDILDAFRKMDRLDTRNAKPSFQPLPVSNVLREDKPGECLPHEKAMKNARNREGMYFRGPKAV